MMEQSKLIPIVIRLATADDLRFVYHSWIRSFGASNIKHDLGLSEWLICRSYEKIIGKRLSDMSVLVAASPEDDTQILGYVVYEVRNHAPSVHFCYVKDFIRKEGIGGRLITKALNGSMSGYYSYPIKNQVSKHLVSKFKLSFNPFHLLGVFIEDPRSPGGKKEYDQIKVHSNVSAS